MRSIFLFFTCAVFATTTSSLHFPVHDTNIQLRRSVNGTASPFHLTYAFSAHLNLAATTKPVPIPIPGGFLVTEPIVNGTVTGPYINATVHGGIAAPAIYSNQTIQAPRIYLYGSTADNRPFYVEEIGIGSPGAQVTRITISLNATGNPLYQKLVDGYILATVNPNSYGSQVNVQGWLIENVANFG